MGIGHLDLVSFVNFFRSLVAEECYNIVVIVIPRFPFITKPSLKYAPPPPPAFFQPTQTTMKVSVGSLLALCLVAATSVSGQINPLFLLMGDMGEDLLGGFGDNNGMSLCKFTVESCLITNTGSENSSSSSNNNNNKNKKTATYCT